MQYSPRANIFSRMDWYEEMYQEWEDIFDEEDQLGLDKICNRIDQILQEKDTKNEQ